MSPLQASPKKGLSYLEEFFRWKEKSSMTLLHHQRRDNSLLDSFNFAISRGVEGLMFNNIILGTFNLKLISI